MNKDSFFGQFARRVAAATGSPIAFILAFSLIILWGACGPLFEFSDTWQLVINTGTTIITFLMVFIIQSSQNKDTLALQLKLDELIRANDGADNKLLDLEEMNDKDLTDAHQRFLDLAEHARNEIDERGTTNRRQKSI